MTEEGIIVLKDNKNQSTNKEENKNELRPKVDINDYNQEVLDSKENLEKNPPKNEQLGFNKKNIYELSFETIEKLGISPCQICQSNNYSIFIPETVYNVSNQNGKPQDQTIEKENQVKNNPEEDYIKPIINQNIFFPILICKKNHQTCLICNKSPHINTLCSQSNIDYYQTISKLNIIKETFSEKANVIESMKESASTLNKNVDYGFDKEQSCCCCYLIYMYKFIVGFILLFIWAVISSFLFSLSINVVIFSFLLNLFYGICKVLCGRCCCGDSSVDLSIASCGFELAKSMIYLIPKGFKKITSCVFND